MQVTLNVKRYDPEAADQTPRFEEFRIEAESHFTVLDGLIKVREEVDPSLAVRCSCRASICGSCAMRVNGHAALACKTKLSTSLHDGAVSVEPMGNQRVVKDLVTDASLFWGKIRAVEPFLQPKGPEPEEEYIASNDAMLNLITPMGCIMCGACVSDCTVLEVDKNFLGPAALAKAYRFVGDPRDEADADRLSTLNEYGRRVGLHALLRVRAGLPKGRCADGPHHGAARGHPARGIAVHHRLAPRRLLRPQRRPQRLA